MRKEWTLFLTFLKIGVFTFGGGYAMIALLENEFVERRNWIKNSEIQKITVNDGIQTATVAAAAPTTPAIL